MKTRRSWGVSPLKAIKSQNHACPVCGASFFKWIDPEVKRLLVGFSISPPEAKAFRHCVIFECKQCNIKLWYHVTNNFAKIYAHEFPNWPDESS